MPPPCPPPSLACATAKAVPTPKEATPEAAPAAASEEAAPVDAPEPAAQEERPSPSNLIGKLEGELEATTTTTTTTTMTTTTTTTTTASPAEAAPDPEEVPEREPKRARTEQAPAKAAAEAPPHEEGDGETPPPWYEQVRDVDEAYRTAFERHFYAWEETRLAWRAFSSRMVEIGQVPCLNWYNEEHQRLWTLWTDEVAGLEITLGRLGRSCWAHDRLGSYRLPCAPHLAGGGALGRRVGARGRSEFLLWLRTRGYHNM